MWPPQPRWPRCSKDQPTPPRAMCYWLPWSPTSFRCHTRSTPYPGPSPATACATCSLTRWVSARPSRPVWSCASSSCAGWFGESWSSLPKASPPSGWRKCRPISTSSSSSCWAMTSAHCSVWPQGRTSGVQPGRCSIRSSSPWIRSSPWTSGAVGPPSALPTTTAAGSRI